MADNIAVTPGAGATVAADEVGAALHQRVKISLGADGSATDALGGAGAVAAGVQRVTLASDDPAVVALTSATPAGEAYIGQTGGTITVASANFTRPNDTTAYAIGDLIANSTTVGSVAPLQFTVSRVAGGSGFIRRARVYKSGITGSPVSIRTHFFSVSPVTITNGDNGVFSVSGVADYIGKIDITLDQVFTDGVSGSGVPYVGSEMNFKLASGQIIYALTEARSVYTPSAQEVFTVKLEVHQN